MGRSSRIAAEAASQVSGGGGASSDDGGVGFVTGKEVDEFRTYDDTGCLDETNMVAWHYSMMRQHSTVAHYEKVSVGERERERERQSERARERERERVKS